MSVPTASGLRSSLSSSRTARNVLILVIAGFAASIPTFASPYAIGLTNRFMVFSILALSMDLLWGYGGVVSFGHAMFFGLGAYATAITLNNFGGVGATYGAFALGIGVPALLALALGYFLFYSQVAGVYFGIVTLALSVVFETLAIVNRDITGGLDGLYGFAIPTIWVPGLGDLEIWGTVNPYYAGLIGLALALSLSVWITRSSFGTAIKAIRDDEARLEMLGYDTAFLKTVLLVISCAMAGCAGTLYTTVGFVSSQLFAVFFSTQVLVWVGIGGRGTLVGPILGTILVGFLETVLSGEYQDIWPLLVGLFFLLVVLFWPSGLYPLLQRMVAIGRRQRIPERAR